MTLAAHGVRRTQKQIALRAKTNAKVGTQPARLVAALQEEGMPVRVGQRKTLAQIEKALKEEKIVIVLFLEPEEDVDHYAIVREIKDGFIVLLDPYAKKGRTSMTTKEFLRRWKDKEVSRTRRWAAIVG